MLQFGYIPGWKSFITGEESDQMLIEFKFVCSIKSIKTANQEIKG